MFVYVYVLSGSGHNHRFSFKSVSFFPLHSEQFFNPTTIFVSPNSSGDTMREGTVDTGMDAGTYICNTTRFFKLHVTFSRLK